MRIETQVECLDYMSQLASGVVVGFSAGTVMNYVGETPGYGVNILAIKADGDYIFLGGSAPFFVDRYLKSTMAIIDGTVSYGANVNCILTDETYVYVAGEVDGAGHGHIKRYLKSTMAYINESVDFTVGIQAMTMDATHLYVSGAMDGGGHYHIGKFLKDLTYVTSSPDYGSATYALANDDNYVYAGTSGGAAFPVRKYLKSTMALVTSSPDYGGAIWAMALDGLYLYVGGATVNTIKKYLLSDLSNTGVVSPSYGGDIYTMVVSGDYIYAGGTTTEKVRRYFKTDLVFSDESPTFNGAIHTLDVDGDHVYIGGGSATFVCRKYSLFDTVTDMIDDLLVFPMQLPAVTKGTISATYASLIRNIQASGQSILKTLLALRDTVGGYLEVDNNRLLQWTTTLGENKGQQIRYRKNLLGIEREIDYVGFYNRIYAYGQTSTGVRIKLSDVQPLDYVEDTTSQTTWGGIYVGTFMDFTILSSASLLEWANNLLAVYKDPLISYRINSVDLSAHTGFEFDTLQLGSTVVVIDEDLGINVSATVIKIEYPDLMNPQDMIIELTNFVRNATDTLASLKSVQKDLALAL